MTRGLHQQWRGTGWRYSSPARSVTLALSMALCACIEPETLAAAPLTSDGGPFPSDEGPPPSGAGLSHAEAPALAGPLRLTELLGEARIDSPLANAEALRFDAADLGELASRRLLGQDFERFSPRWVAWPRTAGCRAAPAPARQGKALLYDGRNAHQCAFVIPAKPSTRYLLSRAILTGDGEIDLRVMESRVALKHSDQLNHPADIAAAAAGKFVAMRELLFVHRFTKPRGDETWQEDRLTLVTSPFARSLVIAVHDAEGLLAQREHGVWFDDLVVEELRPTREQELGLLKGESLAPGADPALGLHKHGQLLPVGSVSNSAPPFDGNCEYRYGLLAVAPTTLEFPVTPPAGARLDLSLGLFKTSTPGDRVTFHVTVQDAKGEQTALLEQELDCEPRKNWHWHDLRLPLERWAGQPVTLRLTTAAPPESKGLGVWGTPIIHAPRRAGEPPNVVLLAVDTLRADRLHTFGYERPTSPQLDRLAEDGVTFMQAVSASNWTSPSFASLFTGVYPSRHQVIHRARAIPETLPTLTEHLRRAGWTTYAVVYKAYLYNMGFERGFDRWFNLPLYDVRADVNLAKSLAWLDAHQDERFFLFLHFNDPHQPFNQPPPFDRKFNSVKDLQRFGLKLPIVIEPHGGVRGCSRCMNGKRPAPGFTELGRDLYDGATAYVDDQVGRFIEALRERGLYDNTVIGFVSDHGELMWEHGNYFGHGGTYIQDELVHVPLLVKPHTQAALPVGRRVDTMVRSIDLMPTLLELAGIDTTELELQAESLAPLLRDEGTPTPRTAFSENVKQAMLAVRKENWKYVLEHPPGRPPRESLFDLGADPHEKLNVAAEQLATLRTLRSRAIAFFLENRRGHYLLVLGDGLARTFEIEVTADQPIRSVQSLFGLPVRVGRERQKLRFRGESDRPVVLLARLELPRQAHITVTLHGTGDPPLERRAEVTAADFDAYVQGWLKEHLRPEATSVHFLRVEGLGDQPHERRHLSGERLEALRALGYIQ